MVAHFKASDKLTTAKQGGLGELDTNRSKEQYNTREEDHTKLGTLMLDKGTKALIRDRNNSHSTNKTRIKAKIYIPNSQAHTHRHTM